MRTSNKIILGIFLSPLLVFTLINLALYAKLKSGNYVLLKKVQEDRYLHYPLKSVTQVAVYGLGNFHVMPSDNGKLEIEKSDNHHLHYIFNDGVLTIHGDTTIKEPGRQDHLERSNERVSLYLPVTAFIAANESEVTLYGAKDSAQAKSYQVALNKNSSLEIERNNEADSVQIYFKNLDVKSQGNNRIELNRNIYIKALQLVLNNTDFEDQNATIESLSLQTDENSRLNISGANLNRIKR